MMIHLALPDLIAYAISDIIPPTILTQGQKEILPQTPWDPPTLVVEGLSYQMCFGTR